MRSRYEKWRVRPNRLAVKGWGGEDSHSSGLGERYCSYQFTRDSPRQVSTSPPEEYYFFTQIFFSFT